MLTLKCTIPILSLAALTNLVTAQTIRHDPATATAIADSERRSARASLENQAESKLDARMSESGLSPRHGTKPQTRVIAANGSVKCTLPAHAERDYVLLVAYSDGVDAQLPVSYTLRDNAGWSLTGGRFFQVPEKVRATGSAIEIEFTAGALNGSEAAVSFVWIEQK